MAKSLVPSKHLYSLQIVRAIAATSVVYFHTAMIPQFGSFGVDLFFVLSGLVITMVVESNLTVAEFISARITRIIPLYWLLTTGVLVVAAIRPDLLNSTTVSLSRYLKSLFFVPYYKESGALQPMLDVGWTLNYEMLFYALAAIAMTVVGNRYFVLATAALVSSCWALGHVLPAGLAMGEFLRSDVLFDFIFGMVGWKLRGLTVLKMTPAWALAALIVALYILMSFFEVSKAGFRPLAFGLPSLLVVLCALGSESTIVGFNRTVVRLLAHIGDASYATYLSHLFIVEFVRKVAASRLPALSMDGPLGAFTGVVFSLVGGSVLYLVVDKRAVRWLRALTGRAIGSDRPAAPLISAGSAKR